VDRRIIVPHQRGNCKVSDGHGVERQILRALGSIGSATLLSRIVGFARDMVVALAFGAGVTTDAFFVAYRIPNMLRRLLGEGALSAAVVPVIAEYAMRRPPADSVRMLRALLGATLLVLSVATLLGLALAPWVVRLMAPGFVRDPDQEALASLLTRVMFPYLALVGLSALAMGTLNAHGRFFASAFAPAIQNIGMILCVTLLASQLSPPVLSLAIGVVLGGLGQLAVQLPDLRRSGCLVSPSGEVTHPAVGQVARLLLPSVVGLAAVQVNVFVNTLLASLLAPGSISFLYYADRVMEFPLGVFGIALASAALPSMARQASSGDRRSLALTLGFALRMSLFVSIPASLGLILLRIPITRVLFERGRFTAADTAATSEALLWFAVGLAGIAGARIAAQTFYAVQQPAVTVRFGVLAVAVNIVAATVLMRPFGHAGLAAAASVAGYVNMAALLWEARRRLGPIGGTALLGAFARTTAACVPLALVCTAARWLWPAGPGLIAEAGWLLLTILTGTAAFVATAWWLGSPEVRLATDALLRRRRS
jgi:putative peptidoglycan lipid II flippase